jgi:glutaredoxin
MYQLFQTLFNILFNILFPKSWVHIDAKEGIAACGVTAGKTVHVKSNKVTCPHCLKIRKAAEEKLKNLRTVDSEEVIISEVLYGNKNHKILDETDRRDYELNLRNIKTKKKEFYPKTTSEAYLMSNMEELV